MLGACRCAEVWTPGLRKSDAIGSVEVVTGSAMRLVSVEAVTRGCSAGHEEEADRSGLCGRQVGWRAVDKREVFHWSPQIHLPQRWEQLTGVLEVGWWGYTETLGELHLV